MSQETTSTSEDILDDLALRHALGTLEGTERAEFETCMNCPHSRAGKLATAYTELVGAVTLAALPAGEPPPPEVKERVVASIRTREAAKAATHAVPPHVTALLMAGDDLPWMSTPYRGVRIRELSTDSPDYSIIMLSCDPGAIFPPHHHAGSEDVYIMSGEAVMDGRVLRAGDFLHANAGSHHPDMMISQSGCQAMIITSSKNYSPRAARAYSVAHRVVSRIGRALGVGAGK
ncbi:MAG: cupin domain-containing protein [Prosthecobacter sp.]|uniref:cupin domain-containing protein n=1 Tax=Prosthecobacter sp. TaxID=1965333 RepID=UPI003903AE16